MKKIIYIIAFCAIAVACSKEVNGVHDGNELYFTAVIEQPVPAEKASFSNNTIVFEAGDKIRVCDANASTKKGATYQATGVFKIDSGLTETAPYYAVYRYQATPATGNTDGAIANLNSPSSGYEMKLESIIYPYQQAVTGGVDQNSCPMLGKAGADKEFKFVQMASLLKFDLGISGVTRVVLSSNDNVYIAGRTNINVKDENSDGWLDTFLVGTSSPDYSSITLIPPSGQSTFPNGTYYIATRPDRNCTGGLTLTIYGEGDTVLKTVTKTNTVKLNRGAIRYLGSFFQ